MILRALVVMHLLCLLACTAPPRPLINNTPELALAEIYPDDGPLDILANHPTTNGVILFFSAENRGLAALNDPHPRIGSANLEHEGNEWIALISTLNSLPDPATLPDQTFTYGTNRGNHILFLQGNVLDERIFWIEARLVNGDVVRTAPVQGIFTMVSPTFNGFCAIRALDGNEAVVEAHLMFGDARCIPDPFWSSQ